jgi:hypothetical protein
MQVLLEAKDIPTESLLLSLTSSLLVVIADIPYSLEILQREIIINFCLLAAQCFYEATTECRTDLVALIKLATVA